MKKILTIVLCLAAVVAQAQQVTPLHDGWKFALGNAADSAWHGIEHCFDGKEFTVPAFNGRALLILETDPEQWDVDLDNPPFRISAGL